jgi:hypothetical protein
MPRSSALRMSLKAILAIRSMVTPALVAEALTGSSTWARTLSELAKCEAVLSLGLYPAWAKAARLDKPWANSSCFEFFEYGHLVCFRLWGGLLVIGSTQSRPVRCAT